MANSTSSVRTPITFQNVRQFDRPVQDEWGIFDPQQAGLEALLRRLKSPGDVSEKDTALAPAAVSAKK